MLLVGDAAQIESDTSLIGTPQVLVADGRKVKIWCNTLRFKIASNLWPKWSIRRVVESDRRTSKACRLNVVVADQSFASCCST